MTSITVTSLPKTLFIRCDAIKKGISHDDKGGRKPVDYKKRFFPRTETFLVALQYEQKFKN